MSAFPTLFLFSLQKAFIREFYSQRIIYQISISSYNLKLKNETYNSSLVRFNLIDIEIRIKFL